MSAVSERVQANADAAIAEHRRMQQKAQGGGCLWLFVALPLVGLLLGRLLA